MSIFTLRPPFIRINLVTWLQIPGPPTFQSATLKSWEWEWAWGWGYTLYTSHTIYFIVYFPQVLLISTCPRMWVQFKGRNKTRAGSINITTLVRSYMHDASNSFGANEREICMYVIVMNWPKLTVLHIHATVWSQYEWFQQVSLHVEALLEWLNRWMLSHTHPINCAHVRYGNYLRAGFISFNSSRWFSTETNSRAEKI